MTTCRYCDTPLAVGALFCVECGRSVAEAAAPTVRTPPRRLESVPPVVVAAPGPVPDVAVASEPESAPEPAPASAPTPDPDPAPDPAPAAPDDTEATRLMASRGRGDRYVLQFSTGESIVVAGTGIIGRGPTAEPGEYVDQLVTVFDVGKSVSKAHVEFGQDAGQFWVSDRHSTNGTVVRQPDAEPVRCDPGKRYHLARGSRVDIGDQFFVVS